MKLIKGNLKDLEIQAAELISTKINSLAQSKENIVLGIVGGRSVAKIFNLVKDKPIPWGKVHIFMADERIVSIADTDSNFKLAKEAFIDNLVASKKLPKENIHPFIMNNTPNYGISDYSEELKKYGKFDIIILSSGEDGHIAALFPNHHSIENTEEGFISMNDSPKPPSLRMSASRKLLSKADIAILLFFGENKKDALKNFVNPEIKIEQCPAKIITLCKEAYVFTDMDNSIDKKNSQ